MLKNSFAYRYIFQNYLIPARPVTGAPCQDSVSQIFNYLKLTTVFLTTVDVKDI